ncbi:hypothetical protein P43SY_003196 [Pythium insidiosum]|uniref:Uncharacterized protein n=1 Tax=Pythium insidiosum TaxID=114742 RepID=A0AAD5LRS4_PYTIN|nr:hypothetical protein P43SY_003196 [Pythium insidiosum]KAJ0392687.1 hypothetical protein ATCC90586_008662 [Pythium insidiosum]
MTWRELAASTRVLFWKNVRVKQRQAQWRRSSSGLGVPFLLLEVALPLCAVLLMVKVLCEINTRPHQNPDDSSDDAHIVALSMTALSRLLALTNSSIVTLDRPENHEFLSYLDTSTPRDDALGFLPVKSFAKVVPFEGTPRALARYHALEVR